MLGSIFHLQSDLSLKVDQGGINLMLPRNTGVVPIWNSNVRIIQMSKSLDNVLITDKSIDKLKIELNKHLDFDNSLELKFILEFEREETLLNKDRIDIFHKIFENHAHIIITNNINQYNGKDIFFINNNVWIFDYYQDKSFNTFLKELRIADLGTIKKKFMFLNNHYSDIRWQILKFIYSKNKQSDGNISFNLINFDSNPNLNKEELLKEIEDSKIPYPLWYDSQPTLTQISDNERIKKTLLGINHVATLPHFNYRVYLESFYEIITETENHLIMDECHISEKIIKPLKSAMPFIYYGKEKMKEILEEIGFKFTSPIYYFGMGDGFFNHLDMLLNMDHNWFNYQQKKYLDEYFYNLEVWNSFLIKNNREIIKFAYI